MTNVATWGSVREPNESAIIAAVDYLLYHNLLAAAIVVVVADAQ